MEFFAVLDAPPVSQTGTLCFTGVSDLLTLSATIGPDVALVSAAITTPPSKIHPTIVVPVLVALGKGTP